MIETIYKFSDENKKVVEQVVDDDNILIMHMIFPEGNGLAEHYSNSNVYMTVIRGTLTLQLESQEPHKYENGSAINIPYKTKMNVNNLDKEILEIFVIKSPNPRFYQEKK